MFSLNKDFTVMHHLTFLVEVVVYTFTAGHNTPVLGS